MNEEEDFETEGFGIEEVEEDDAGDLDEDRFEGSGGGYDPTQKYTKKELEELADVMLREDANRELCRKCRDTDPDSIPYGYETGEIEWQVRKGTDGMPAIDDEGNTQYIAFPELRCEKGHRWYKGEGPRRDIRGKNPILFETHLYNRKRREIHVKDGIPDPAFTMDRWGKRPTQGIYNRAHPQGRKINTPEQRAKNGASWYR